MTQSTNSAVRAERNNPGMIRPAVLVNRLLTTRGTPDYNDELATTAAVALCAGPNGTIRLIHELINHIPEPTDA